LFTTKLISHVSRDSPDSVWQRFQTIAGCLQYLMGIKWSEDFKCSKCDPYDNIERIPKNSKARFINFSKSDGYEFYCGV
jgi:hypothetical protein